VEEGVRRVNLIRDRVYVWFIVWTILALAVAVDPPFGFGGLSIVASVAGGALIGVLVSRYYSQRASEELRREAGELRHYVDILATFLDSLEINPRVRVGRNPETGRIESVQLLASAVSSGRSSVSASATVKHPQDRGREAEGD
jgi:hypothetical protein